MDDRKAAKRRVAVVLNRQSGALRGADLDAYCAHVAAEFAAAGCEASCARVDGPDIVPALERAARESSTVIAGGGDGTISAAAAIAWKTGTTLGVIPAGTMNLFARGLKMPLDIRQAATALARGVEKNCDMASANGRPFIHQFSIGLQPRMVRQRQRFDYRTRIGKMLASVRAAASVLARPPVMRVRLTIDGEVRSEIISLLAVSNNLYGPGPLPVAERLDEGRLGIYRAGILRSGEAMSTGLQMLRGAWRESPALKAGSAREVVIELPMVRGKDRASMDGELVALEKETRIVIHPGELRILVPRPEDENGGLWERGSGRHALGG